MNLFGDQRKKYQYVGESISTTMIAMNNNNNNNNLINNNNTNHHHHQQQVLNSFSTTTTSDGCTTTDKSTVSSDSSGVCTQFGDDYRDVFVEPRHLEEIKGHDNHINHNWRTKERVCFLFDSNNVYDLNFI